MDNTIERRGTHRTGHPLPFSPRCCSANSALSLLNELTDAAIAGDDDIACRLGDVVNHWLGSIRAEVTETL